MNLFFQRRKTIRQLRQQVRLLKDERDSVRRQRDTALDTLDRIAWQQRLLTAEAMARVKGMAAG